MANIKFSQFTNQAAADTTYLVGYDGTDNTNYTKAQIKHGLLQVVMQYLRYI